MSNNENTEAFKQGFASAYRCIAAAERHNVRAGLIDRCPYAVGTPEEKDYDAGWNAAVAKMKEQDNERS